VSALARTALRLAAIEALKADPVIAALCGTRIYDSRIEDFSATEAVPMIVLLSEKMEGEAWSKNNGGPPFDDRCDLTVEIAMRAVARDEDDEPFLGTVETSAEMEAALDTLEQRVLGALTIADTPQSLLVRQAVTRRVSKQESTRYVSPDSEAKAAMRQLNLTVELKGEDQRDARQLASPVVAASADPGNHGNGTLTLLDPGFDDTIIAGSYAVAFSDATHFTVTDPRGVTAAGFVGRDFNGGVRFVIEAGGTAFAAGDGFTLQVTQGPYAALPDPLRTVCEALPDGSAGALICQAIAGAYGAPAAIPFFTGAEMTVAPQPALDPAAPPPATTDPSAEPSFGVTVDIPEE
jgi:hypothetical protein